jgi:hypothetical protein
VDCSTRKTASAALVTIAVWRFDRVEQRWSANLAPQKPGRDVVVSRRPITL